MANKKSEAPEVELREQKELKRIEVIGTDGAPVWIPTVTIGAQNKELSNIEKMMALGWTKEELERTAKFAPRAPRKIKDGKEVGAYKFINGCSYSGFGSMFDPLERLEEKARHNKTQSVSGEVARRIDWKTVSIMEKVPVAAWEAVLDGNEEVDNITKMFLKVMKHFKDLKAPEEAFKDLNELFKTE